MGTSNVQHRTSNVEVVRPRRYDLEERLLDYSAAVIEIVERLPPSRAGNHIAAQLLKSGTSPLPNHGESQAAESPSDFVHKLRVCLKELRESLRWLLLIDRVPKLRAAVNPAILVKETDELIRIFVASIRTSERKRG